MNLKLTNLKDLFEKTGSNKLWLPNYKGNPMKIKIENISDLKKGMVWWKQDH